MLYNVKLGIEKQDIAGEMERWKGQSSLWWETEARKSHLCSWNINGFYNLISRYLSKSKKASDDQIYSDMKKQKCWIMKREAGLEQSGQSKRDIGTGDISEGAVVCKEPFETSSFGKQIWHKGCRLSEKKRSR